MKSLLCAISIIIMTISNGNIDINFEKLINDTQISQSQVQETSEQGSFFMQINGVEYYFTEESQENVEKVSELIGTLPSCFTMNIKKIEFKGKNGDVLGTANGQNIVLYDFDRNTLKDKKIVLYHEIAHTFGNMLKNINYIDNRYSEYAEEVIKDDNYITDYAKKYIKEHQNYSEDFADSFAYYFYN